MKIVSSPIWTLLLCGLAENSLTSGSEHPCATVSCYYNAMCMVDPDTNLGFCDCRSSECDTHPYLPICADGITFNSYCHAHIYMCENQREVKFQHGGVCNSFDCGPTTSCSFHGVCDGGSCKCDPCNSTVFDVDGLANPSQPVCGSDGVHYDSKCLMEYESCISRKAITVAKDSRCIRSLQYLSESGQIAPANLMVDHLRNWISEIESEDKINSEHLNEITSRRTRGTVDVCRNVELHGCLPDSHPRKQFLGTYVINRATRFFGSPVYRRIDSARSRKKKPVYLSRFKSAKVYDGSWIVGSQIASGRGWFSVFDPASNPQNISGTWYSTSGSRGSRWRKELTIRLHCRGEKMKRKHPLSECIDDEVIGTYETNSRNGTDDTPFYRLTLTNRHGVAIDTYRPGERVKVIVRHTDRTNRFKTIYLAMQNDVDECGVPGLRRSRKRFASSCYSQMISREAGRMGRVKMQFNMPLRGCVTFNVLLKSTKDEVFYDFSSSEGGIVKHLTKTVCPNTGSVD